MNNDGTQHPDAAQAAQPKQPGLYIPPLSILECYTQPPPTLDFVIPGLLAGTCGALVSQGGVGKSMLALILHCLVASGNTIGRFDQLGTGSTGPCTYVGLEDPVEIIHTRIHNISAALAVKHGSSAVDFWHDAGTVIPAYGAGIKISNPAHIDWLKRVSEGQRLVIIDTLRRVHDRDENSNGEMAEVLGAFESITAATGAAILLLHHTGKGSNDTARGASAITDNLRYVASLRAANDDERKGFRVAAAQAWKHVVIEVGKCNYSAPIEPLWLVKGPHGIPECIGSVEAVLAGAAATPAAATPAKEYADDDF